MPAGIHCRVTLEQVSFHDFLEDFDPKYLQGLKEDASIMCAATQPVAMTL